MKQEYPMDATEFQIEPHATGTQTGIGLQTETPHDSRKVSQAGIESLLLGLNLRGWLTDSEKRLLDLLTAANCTTFICHDGHYVHPDNFDLFPVELIDTSPAAGSTAIFSQRFHPPQQSHPKCYRIHTAALDPRENPATILGMYGTEIETQEQESAHHFTELLLRFRKAANRIESLTTRLKTALASTLPTAVINRASARIVSANSAFCEMMAKQPRAVIDQEYSRLTGESKGALTSAAKRMDNIGQSALNLTIVSIDEPPVHNASHDSSITSFFTHKMRNKIASITTAASYLDTAFMAEEKPDKSELTRMILTEASELDQQLSRLNLLVNCQQLEPREACLRHELEQAVELVRSDQEETCLVEIAGRDLYDTVTSKPQALMFLFETILRSHVELSSCRSRTRITGNRSSTHGALTVRVETELAGQQHTAKMEPNWKSYVSCLADRMGLSLSQNNYPEERKLVTTINITY